MCKNRYWTFALLIILAVPMLGSAPQNKYDSVWWQATPLDERTQFIAGYLDCAAYDFGRTKLSDAQWNVIEPKITMYFASHSGTIPRTVPSLILSLGRSSHSADREPEIHAGQHGIFDGNYWREITPSGRLGFVEGYNACRSSKPNQKRFLTHPATWYVIQIDETYKITPDNDIDEHVASAKIAIIIQDYTPL